MSTKRVNNIFVTILITTALLLYGLAYYVNAYPNYHGHMHGHLSEAMTDWMAEKLALTEDQKKQFDSYRKDIAAHVMDIQDSGIDFKKQIIKQLEDGELNEDELNETVEAYNEKLGKLTTLIVNRLSKFYNGLNEDQKLMFTKIMSEYSKAGCQSKE